MPFETLLSFLSSAWDGLQVSQQQERFIWLVSPMLTPLLMLIQVTA
jgi:hypothetical protein